MAPALGVPHGLRVPPVQLMGLCRSLGPRLAPCDPDSPLRWTLLGATHHALGSLAPRPSHSHLHLHLPGREEDRNRAPHGAAPVLHGWDQPHFLRAQDGICGPVQLRAWAVPFPAPTIILSYWPGPGPGRRKEVTSRPAVR